MAKAFSEFERYRGKNSNVWKGGYFPYYGENWFEVRRKILKKVDYGSEMNKLNGGKLHIHHIIAIRGIVNKYIELSFTPYIPEIKDMTSLRVLPYELIPDLLFKEANSPENLVVLTEEEHGEYEGMPIGFFDAVKRLR